MLQTKLFAFVAALTLLQYVVAQQSCVNTCTDSANVLTQLKTCSGCGTDDFACFCRCPQYIDALISCTQQNCAGSDVENSIISFCSSQGVSISYSSGSVSIGSATGSASSRYSSATVPTTLSTTGTAAGIGPFLSSTNSGSSLTATSGSSLTATDSSDISSYLATAIPASARTQSSDACFVNTPYTYYPTPTWYNTLPTQAQSYYSSINQGNTAACTLSSAAAAALAGSKAGHHGLSGGAIAGIVIGALLAALLLALLLLLCLRRRRRAGRDAAAARARDHESRNTMAGMYGDKRGLAGGAAPIANGRATQAPYGHGGTNGLAAIPTEKTGHQMPYGAGANMGGPAAVGGGAALGTNGNPDYSHTTTTTTRVRTRTRL